MADNRIPSASVPFVDQRGFVSQAWFRFLSNLIGPAEPLAGVIIGPSPFSYEASRPGHVLIDGGTVSGVKLQRGAVLLNVPAGLVPVAQGDAVVVTYTVAPSIHFVPA